MRESKARRCAGEDVAGLMAGLLLAGWVAVRGRGPLGALVAGLGLLVAAGSGAVAGRASSRRCAPLRRPEERERFGEHTRDLVEEASWESFPASDPPAYL